MIDAWEDEGYGAALAVVLATSRHRHAYDEHQARWLLAHSLAEHLSWPDKPEPQLGYPFGIQRATECMLREFEPATWTWHSVTKTEHHDDFCECDPGGWCAEGRGKAWMRVVFHGVASAEAILDEELKRWPT